MKYFAFVDADISRHRVWPRYNTPVGGNHFVGTGLDHRERVYRYIGVTVVRHIVYMIPVWNDDVFTFAKNVIGVDNDKDADNCHQDKKKNAAFFCGSHSCWEKLRELERVVCRLVRPECHLCNIRNSPKFIGP
jgi:hypothetical protein